MLSHRRALVAIALVATLLLVGFIAQKYLTVSFPTCAVIYSC